MEPLEKRLAARSPLWGHWVLGERIYRSSNCSVYLLCWDRLDEPVESVVKVVTLLGSGQELEDKRRRVMEEIHAMEQLRSCGNAVTLLDDAIYPLLEEGDLCGYDILLRMEHLTCLSDLLREGEVLPPEEVRRLAFDLGRALADAHRLGIIHRDIKPANIYRTAQGTYQLGDFSVARQTRRPLLETMTGTMAYMAPEVARGDAYDGRADLYSLGVVLYQLLNGNHLPMTNDDSTLSQRENAVRRRWNGDRLPPPSGDRRLCRMVLRCCQSMPAKRFPSAQALLDALRGPTARRGWIPAAVIGWCCAIVAVFFLVALPRPEMSPAGNPATGNPSVFEPDTPETPVSLAESDADDTLEQATVTHRYTVVKAQMTWDEARIYCESRGGHLATILDQEQFDTVASLLEEHGITQAWLGASDLNSSNGFQWVTDDTFSFAVWGLGEPNHTNGTEHYLMMYNKEDQGWVWNDSHERGMWLFPSDTCGFICQWDETDG